MNDKEMTEYSQWMWADTMRSVVQAVAIYGVLLGAYWVFIG
jgi:hypothetical protein